MGRYSGGVGVLGGQSRGAEMTSLWKAWLANLQDAGEPVEEHGFGSGVHGKMHWVTQFLAKK